MILFFLFSFEGKEDVGLKFSFYYYYLFNLLLYIVGEIRSGIGAEAFRSS